MLRVTAAILVALLVVSVCVAGEFREYPEFRYVSGLPGGGFGVTPDHGVGFDGALQLNIPVGYTPGAGSYALGGYTSATDGGFPTDYDGPDVNGTAMLGLGGLWRGHGLWFSDMETGVNGESAYNLQVELVPARPGRPGVSLGVVDLFGRRTSDLERPFDTDARSFFVVATWAAGNERHPLWATLGAGNGRFNDRLFGGVSYQATDRLKVLAEYDGWNVNAGAAYDIAGDWGDGEWHAVAVGGLTDLDRITIGVTVTRTSPDDWPW